MIFAKISSKFAHIQTLSGIPRYFYMTDKFFSSLNNALADGRMAHVVDVLSRKCVDASASHPDLISLLPGLRAIADTYSHMRQFMLDGKPDPNRDMVYDSLVSSLRDIARQYLFIAGENSLDPLFADYRLQKTRGRSMTDMLDELNKNEHRRTMAEVTEADPQQFVKRKEEIIANIFRKVWSLPPIAKSDREVIASILASTEPDSFALKSQVVSALLLGLLGFYDPAKFLLLLNAYAAEEDDRLAARMLTAIVLVLSRHSTAVLYDAPVKMALESLADSILTYTRLRDVVMTIIKTRDTDRVNREVSDAFNTTMKNLSPELLDKLRREGMAIDAGETGGNPEWENLLKNKELEEKMQRINDMQLEGLDVMMQSFARLKSFPFFQSLPNWFLPFSFSHSQVSPLSEVFDEEAFNAMAAATDMCASDRFSFSFGILQMPEERRKMLATSVRAQMEAFNDIVADRGNVRRKPEFASEALIFARDLYRFAKLYPNKRGFHDPFELPLDFLHLPVLGSLLDEDDVIMPAADFYFNHGYYALALPLYEEVVGRSGNASRLLFEKIGYACQMEGNLHKALQNYEKADLFSSDTDRSSLWLLKKLAFVNKALGYYGKAAEFYEKVLERNPDDLNLEYHLGSVLLRSGDVKRAKELLAKVNYLNPDHKQCDRILTRLKAHEAFLEGNFGEAAQLYEKARADQDQTSYRKDIIAELGLMGADFDLRSLQILLDN